MRGRTAGAFLPPADRNRNWRGRHPDGRTSFRVGWGNLKMTTEEEERLPGYSDPAVIRHFDAPEAMGVKFFEVRAKSALNRVPEISQVPFRWTINPYRGCTHSCVFCFARPTHEYLGMNAGEDFDR